MSIVHDAQAAGNQNVSTENQNSNVVAFRPRASSLAVHAIHAAGLTYASTRHLEAIAAHVRFATAYDAKRWKVQPGEVFSFAKLATVAAEAGVSTRTLKTATREGREAGVLEVRQTSRTTRAFVFTSPPTAPPASPLTSPQSEPRTEPRTDPRVEPRK